MQTANVFIDLIKSAGYRVFVRSDDPTYCYYTDGIKIGYAQWSNHRYCVTSVHKANHCTGTGFAVANEITQESIKAAINCFAPGWAYQRDIESVKKYTDFNAFIKSSAFNAELIEV